MLIWGCGSVDHEGLALDDPSTRHGLAGLEGVLDLGFAGHVLDPGLDKLAGKNAHIDDLHGA